MSLTAAKVSINSQEPDHWQFIQTKFQLKHRTALYRIQTFYIIAVNETVHNSQMNFVKFIRLNPEYFVSPNYDNITQGVQYALEQVAPNKQWFVQVYEAKADYNQYQASRCVDCFTVFNVNNSYHIFAAGIDSDAPPNPSVQFHNWIDFERQKDYVEDLQQFVEDVYNTYCVNGVFAVLNNVKNSIAYPDNWPATGYIFLKDKITFIAWSVVDSCPGWE